MVDVLDQSVRRLLIAFGPQKDVVGNHVQHVDEEVRQCTGHGEVEAALPKHVQNCDDRADDSMPKVKPVDAALRSRAFAHVEQSAPKGHPREAKWPESPAYAPLKLLEAGPRALEAPGAVAHGNQSLLPRRGERQPSYLETMLANKSIAVSSITS
eukprot:scaffold2144_cov215-Pinguiococcus_pyrenoidosus.AAC.9